MAPRTAKNGRGRAGKKPESNPTPGAEGASAALPAPVEGKTICSKKEFALARGRSPKQVTIWLQKGIISPDAVIGTGHRAKIWVEQADRDIANNMTPGHAAKLEAAAPTPAAPSPDAELLTRRRRAEAEQAEMRVEAQRRQMAVESGRWIEREAAERAWGRELQELLQNIETWAATNMPQEIAAELAVDWKHLSAAVRRSWRAFRQEVADRKRAPHDAVSG